MEVFAYHPAGAETIDAFNARLQAFAFDNDVNGVTAGHIGGTLVLSLVLLEDEIGSPLVLQPFVVPIYPAQLLTLESHLGKVLASLKARDNPDQIYKPVELRTIMIENTKFHTEGGPIGYALFLITIGYDDAAVNDNAE
jgi:hypothetical protein